MEVEMLEVIRSTVSDKTVAVASGTLVLRMVAANKDAAVAAFIAAIDGTRVLRRLGEVSATALPDGVIEVQCEVEYGPVLGAYSDIRKHLKRIVERLGAVGGVVLGGGRREYSMREVEELERKVHDTALSLEAREKLSDLLEQLRKRKEK
jgi:hypothetical protein